MGRNAHTCHCAKESICRAIIAKTDGLLLLNNKYIKKEVRLASSGVQQIMSKVLMIAPEKCIGCRTCELICSFNRMEEFNPKQAAVTVLAYDEAAISVPIMCMQCEDPSCMKVCPVGAIARDENNAVIIEDQRCIGCKMCISACPLGNITFSSKEKKLIKCDLCGGNPQCAELCPSGAIQYKEATPANLNKKMKIGEKFKDLFGEVYE